MENIIFRLVTESDSEKAAIVESESLSTAWSEKQIRDSITNEFSVYTVAVCGEDICGIGSMYCVAGEGQIMNIAVSEKYRRRGIAEGIMNFLDGEAIRRNCDVITLEVAENNRSALSLYEKCGYSPVGHRKGFYGGVDATIMEKTLKRDL